ncbi:GNAT family N-acetyltransferase [Pantoea sp. ME81]|uniref:GNAT family N-acetyltransferase n=1 Tax=Pantoea sp. ME81 TaxID=2743935 RepID=UPI0015F4EBD5|nr:GNAT family N-acetyltransferase [Pantoea sp. ME81]
MKLFSTERTDVYLLTLDHSTSFQRFLLDNRANFAPFEPLRNDEYFAINNISDRIRNALLDYEERKCILMVFTLKNENEIIGSINFTNFIFGVFQACYLGFSLDQAYQGKGLMYEALKGSITYVHDNYKIHRIMANHLPDNLRSNKTLSSLGFAKEGYAQSYLKINGQWQDHILNSLILPE